MGRSLPAVVTGGGCDTGSQDSLIMAKKKGFMTPERKKKLRTLLRKKAAEELKKEQERKAAERQRVISERCGTKKTSNLPVKMILRKLSRSTSINGTTWRVKCFSYREKSFYEISKSMN